jgi:flagellar basal-body rod protein FlgF
MIRGIYTSASGLEAAQQRMNELSGNIANVSTPGFKQILATQMDFGSDVGVSFGGGASAARIGRLSYGTEAVGETIDRLQGPLLTTGSPTDLAISGDGLFAVGTPKGLAYTRAGSFTVDSNGTLATQQGYPVLDTTGKPIAVPGGASSLSVGPDGTVAGTGQRLALVAFPATGLAMLGENLFSMSGPVQPVANGAGTIGQGFLEGSNVDMGASMTELIAVQRTFQLSARSLSLQDQSLDEANAIGKPK